MGQVGGSQIAYHHPFFRAYWQQRKDDFPDDFVQWIETNLIPEVKNSVAPVQPDMMLLAALKSTTDTLMVVTDHDGPQRQVE